MIDRLFGEAWDVQRRRRRRGFMGLALLATAAIVCALAIPSGRGPSPAHHLRTAVTTHGIVTSEILPAGGEYGSLAMVGRRLLVWGATSGVVESEPVASTGTCDVGVVNPGTMALEVARRGSCANPRLFDEHVLLDETYSEGGSTGLIAVVRVSVATQSGGYRIGPVLARSPQCSDCQDGWAYGAGSLWVYVPLALGVPAGEGELLRISEQTGTVLQRWTMPRMVRALLQSDSDGLWIAPSLYSGEPAHVPADEQRDYESIYRIAPGMRTPQRTHFIGPGGARWMVASGSTLWVNTGPPTPTTVTGLEGPHARAAFRADVGTAQCGELGAGAAAVGGDIRVGVDCLGGGENGDSDVFTYSPRSGALSATTPVSMVRPADQAPGVVDGDAFYFLDPPNFTYGPGDRSAAASGAGILYRVAPR